MLGSHLECQVSQKSRDLYGQEAHSKTQGAKYRVMVYNTRTNVQRDPQMS